MDQSLLQDFITESEEHLDEMEANLLELENDPNRRDALDNVFRNAHSIKGNAEYLGIEKIASLSHQMESLLECLRSGQITSQVAIIDTLIRVRDRISILVNDLSREQKEITGIDDLVAELNSWLDPDKTQEDPQAEETLSSRPPEEIYQDLCTFLYDITRSEVKDGDPAKAKALLEELAPHVEHNPENKEVMSKLKLQADHLSYHDDAGDILQTLKQYLGSVFSNNTDTGPSNPDDESYADESDQELFSIYIQHLKENLGALNNLVAQLGTADDVTTLFKGMTQTIASLKSSANYMDYKKAVRLFEQMNADIESFSDNLFLDGDEDFNNFVSQGYAGYLNGLAELFPQARDDIMGSPVQKVGPPVEEVVQEVEPDIVEASPEEMAPEPVGFDEPKEEDVWEAQPSSFEHQGLFDELDSAFDQPSQHPDRASDILDEEPFLKDLEEDLAQTTVKTRDASPAPEESQVASSEADQLWDDEKEKEPEISIVGVEQRLEPADSIQESEPEIEQAPEPAAGHEDEPEPIAVDAEAQVEENMGNDAASEEPAPNNLSRKSVRVDARKIDSLMNQAGELVVARSGFSQIFSEMLDFQHDMQDTGAMELKDLKGLKSLIFRLNEAIQSLGRVANELQDGVMKVRMLPISQLFNRYPRLVRDLTHDTDKQVNLEMIGEETELDKMVIEAIADPLVHMIRNAIDHGAETREERLKAGKPEACTLKLESYHESNHVVIEINDDGRGLDLDHIKKTALKKGLLSKDDLGRMNDRDLTSLIMMPGFSTSGTVTKTSGRGVGMDVVKKNIEKLNGTIEIESVKLKGTRIRIKIPLTLAIIKALLVKVGRDVFTIPLATVEETLQVNRKDLSFIEGVEVIKLRDSVLSLLRLSELFNINMKNEDNEKMYVVVVNTGMRQVGLVVDELIGQEETVIKPLVDYLQENSGFSGATILGDGSISLILDVYDLITISMETRAAHRKSLQSDPTVRRHAMERFGVKHKMPGLSEGAKEPTVH